MTALRTPNIATAEEPCAFCGRTDIHNYIDCITILKREITRLESALAEARRGAVEECIALCQANADDCEDIRNKRLYSGSYREMMRSEAQTWRDAVKKLSALLPAPAPEKETA